ncbi:hypothetical protein [Micromonospora chokoriensis]|nr:hypothetical protein [Micromonospora chokoriensis]
MGVLYDYFRANGDAAAVRLMEDFEGGRWLSAAAAWLWMRLV